ncbi:MAG: PilZ domain-containing protein [Desulfosalsimonadaceae bacterium]
MATDWGKIRKHQRVLFTPKDRITGVFSTQGTATDVLVLDMSLGGLSCIMKRLDQGAYQPGDRLVLLEINDGDALTFSMNTEIEIKWVQDISSFIHVGFGCQFLNLAEKDRERLARFIDDELKKDARNKQVSDSQTYIKTGLN